METVEKDTKDNIEKDIESQIQLPLQIYEQINYIVRYWNII